MGNLKEKTKKVCVIGNSHWSRKLMNVAYRMGILGGVVESNLKQFTFFLKITPVLFCIPISKEL
ncbi:MAG: hypothetical protein GX754_00350 [Clostridiaceae bacterium]|nr:hypothetical protein [Clostridiaceae bacterium]